MTPAIGSRWQCKDLQRSEYCSTFEHLGNNVLRIVELGAARAREGDDVGREFTVDDEWFARRGVEVSA